MEREKTGERILQAALEQFAQRGYLAVSIRDICGAVGIKEGTVYYHFADKRAILQAILARFEEQGDGLTETLFAALGEGVAAPVSMEGVSRRFFEGYLMDPFCNRVLRLLAIEQHHDGELRRLYREWLFDRPLRIQEAAFAQLQRLGLLAGGSAADLAVRYYAPIFFYTQRYLLSGELTEEKKAAFGAAVGRQLAAMERGAC
ncbi:TetR/AcrR family transcriptional regulator [Bittarella massiliensis (ex Durand et al. 2017)]|uniref:TetR/AcrR family transcriptional regulator n=1 Tax=Bittarella massiliensis (ex Durand et al. 2017) TaxID=1720313 RepID=A0AAW5K845_9FIRM|nr:TetR/AcrR family transcriptional regulator [Bittarella massiliensis (ex Durand et al. 2017)]MBC2870455.1 TetR/AcrR family transcriptional regulator [Bittarella massiliensis (ex Durand et al. 2017)]MCQ4949116.1 TetR/AcrR family transcriptional regulator [Bittarella massiliensis (ex Durand et al. 2017)]